MFIFSLQSLSDGIRQSRIKQKLTEFLRFKDRDRTRLSKEEFVELFKVGSVNRP